MTSLFTNADRAALIASKGTQATHSFHDSIDYVNSNRYGTNANGSKYKK